MKYKEITKMNKEDREKKLRDLKVELVKSKARAAKAGSSSTKEIKKAIAKILTFNTSKGGVGKV
jgi:ribosomal protein L29